MRKMISLLSAVVVISIMGTTGLIPLDQVNADNGDCLTRMSEETAKYVKETRLPLKGSDSEFYASKNEQVYMLNSEETLNLTSRKTVKNTVAVINYKDGSGKGSFYVIDQEITPGNVTFFLKKDSKVLQSLPVRLILPPKSAGLAQKVPGSCEQSDCDSINSDTNAQLAALQVEVNRTCKRQTICLPSCHCFVGNLSVAPTIYAVDPTSLGCRKYVEVKYVAVHLWIKVIEGPLLDQAFDTAIKKEARLYTF